MLKDWLKITENPSEIKEIAKRIIAEVTVDNHGEKKHFYTASLLSKMREEIAHYAPDATSAEVVQ